MKEAQKQMLRLVVVTSLLPSFCIIAYCHLTPHTCRISTIMGKEGQRGCVFGLVAVWGLYFVGQWAIKGLSLEPAQAARLLTILLFVAAVCIAVFSIIAIEGRRPVGLGG